MTRVFGLAGYVGGTAVKTGTKPVAAPFHLTAKAATPATATATTAPTGLVAVTGGGLVVVRL